MDLFPSDPTLQAIPIDDGQLSFMRRMPLPDGLTGDAVLARLIDEIDWRAEIVTIYGKRHPQPRLTAWYGVEGYGYSGLSLPARAFTPLLLALKESVEQVTGRQFNSVLLNYYRDERDSMGFHADDERELGDEPAIASLSFGASRIFILKHKQLPKRLKLTLEHQSLLLMAGKLQQFWQHGIQKERQHCAPRINLTFRNILSFKQK
jgi:alkylated DNA repair dioxygenase AlkB